MKVGDKITIERVPAGLYKIHLPETNTYLVGAAASTALTLMREVFKHEANGDLVDDEAA